MSWATFLRGRPASSSFLPPPHQETPASHATANVSTGGKANIALAVSGTRMRNVSCVGAVHLSGSVMTYTAPNAVSASGDGAIACTASNVAGSAGTSVIQKMSSVIPAYAGPIPSTFFGIVVMD